MINRKRVLLMSASMILLCMCVIVGATYALFTDSVTVKNHLQAGNLDLKFERTGLEYTVLDDSGLMVKKVYTDVVDFTETNTAGANIFGIVDDSLIVPGSYVKADLKISHDLDGDENGDSNVAFDYQVYIALSAESDPALADQLYVTITNANGDDVVKSVKLSSDWFNSASDGYYQVLSGKRVTVNTEETFTIKVEFRNVLDNGATNNLAEDQEVKFDVIVEAQQSTAEPVRTETH